MKSHLIDLTCHQRSTDGQSQTPLCSFAPAHVWTLFNFFCCVTCNFLFNDVCTIVTDVSKVAEYSTGSETHVVELDSLICQTV